MVNRFFISGMNKSGTTFLQMLLDAHPEIACPSEQHFNTLINGLPQLVNRYNATLSLFDKNTANQGPGFDQAAFSQHLLKSAIDYLFKFALSGSNKNALHSGLNDNSLIENVAIFTELTPDAKYLFIIRDPRDIGISLWHHKIRTEPDFAKASVPIQDTVKAVIKGWEAIVTATLDFKDKRPGEVHVVRYEDLIGSEREVHLENILDFLSAKREEQIVSAMLEATSFDKLKAKATDKPTAPDQSFYRSGKKAGWKEALDEATKAFASREITWALNYFDYPLS